VRSGWAAEAALRALAADKGLPDDHDAIWGDETEVGEEAKSRGDGGTGSVGGSIRIQEEEEEEERDKRLLSPMEVSSPQGASLRQKKGSWGTAAWVEPEEWGTFHQEGEEVVEESLPVSSPQGSALREKKWRRRTEAADPSWETGASRFELGDDGETTCGEEEQQSEDSYPAQLIIGSSKFFNNQQ